MRVIPSAAFSPFCHPERAQRAKDLLFVLITIAPFMHLTAQPRATLTRDSAARIVAEARKISDVELAPDGSAVLYTVATGSVATNQIVTVAYLQRLTADGSADGQPVELLRRGPGAAPASFGMGWCPSSDCITYADDAGLVRRERGSGRVTPFVVRDTATRLVR